MDSTPRKSFVPAPQFQAARPAAVAAPVDVFPAPAPMALVPTPIAAETPVAVVAADPRIQQLAVQIDLADPGSILRFGQESQRKANAAAEAMLGGARNKDAGEAGATLSSMLGTLRGFDVSKLSDKPGFIARIFTKAGAEVAGVLQKYEGLKGQIEAITNKLDNHQSKLLKDVQGLEELYVSTLEWYRGLGDYIEAGEHVLQQTDTVSLPAVEREAEAGVDPMAPQRVRDLRTARDELERRIHDLRLTRQVAMQALPSIRLIQENDKALAAKIQSVVVNTVPLWRQQLAQALAVNTMRQAASTLKDATDLTNQLLVGNAERLRAGNVEVRTEMERGVFDIEAVKRANAALVGTIEDSLRIADAGKTERAKATVELDKCEAEIRRVLSSSAATAGRR